jgi:serine protease
MSVTKYIVLLSSILLLSVALSSPLFAAASHVPDEIVVKFKSTVPRTRIHETSRRRGMAEIEEHPTAGFRRLRIPMAADLKAMVEEYAAMPDVEYAELNYYYYIATAPNDPYYTYQWNLWHPDAGINVEAAWEITTGEASVIIAVVDSGVAYENYLTYVQAPDLAGTNFVQGRNFIPHPDTNHANDDNAHGTSVAGVIAQTTNNALGCAGIAHGCSIMPIKVMDSTGSGISTDVANGIIWAVDHGANIINLSMSSTIPSDTIENALLYAYNHNVTVVAAAGNSYQSGNPPIYPAAFDQYCIAVGATRYDRTRSYYSSTGSYLDVVAPGGDASIDQNGDGRLDGIMQQTFAYPGDWTSFYIHNWQGTSLSSPHVTAIAALLYSRGINDPTRVRVAIQNTARDLGPAGWDEEYGWGLVDAAAALRYYEITGDLDGDYDVNYGDLWIMCSNWLTDYTTADIAPAGGDGIVDFLDFAVLAADWGVQH